MAKGSFSIQIDPGELKKFQKRISKLPPELGQKAFKSSIRKGAKKMLDATRSELSARAADPTGRLSNAMRVKSTSKYQPYFWKSSVAVRKSKNRKDTSGAHYWHMVEYDRRIVGPGKKDTGKINPGLGFTQAAFDSNKGIVGRSIISDATKKLRALWKKGRKI